MLEPTTRMPLARHACLRTASVEHARGHLSALFWPHRLSLPGQARDIAFQHHQATYGSLSLNALRYGREVALRVAPSDAAYLVKFTLAGHSELIQLGQRVASQPGMVCVMNPGSRFEVRLSADYNQLTLRVDGARLQRLLETQLGYRPRTPLAFLGVAHRWRVAAPGMARMVKTLCDDLDDQAGGLAHGLVAGHLEDALHGLLLSELPHNYSAQFGAASDDAPRALARVRDFIAEHAHEALGLHDLARAAAISTRSLQQIFRLHLGTTPMAYLRDQRLHRARLQLRSAEHASVTAVALASGFTHLSRFARYYRERFGESPHTTRRH